MACVHVKFFGPALQLSGVDGRSFEISDGETLGGLTGRIAEAFPRLGAAVGVRLAVNRAYVALDHRLADGDEVAVIPPVSGG